MIRTILLTIGNEFRLLVRDPVGLFMLILAPIAIIAVAGFSLGSIYGGAPTEGRYVVLFVDLDHGAMASALAAALASEKTLKLEPVADAATAADLVLRRHRAALAIVVQPDATGALAEGHDASLALYVDPVRYLEAANIELRLSELCRAINRRMAERARARLKERGRGLRAQLTRLNETLRANRDQLEARRRDAERRWRASATRAHAEFRAAIEKARRDAERALQTQMAELKARINRQSLAGEQAIAPLARYLARLKTSRTEFEGWFSRLQELAGSHASEIPPPPVFPEPPDEKQLEQSLSAFRRADVPMPNLKLDFAVPPIDFHAPPEPAGAPLQPIGPVVSIDPAAWPRLPGILGVHESSRTAGSARVNTFDQYVPGFGITFLLIGMLMGLSLGLIDEREWGTLTRLRAGGAPLAGMLVGKMIARFLSGLGQLIILFLVGWAVFGVSLGAAPLALLMPGAAISFAAAAFGLLMASLAQTHDTVMPMGAIASMTMSAIGGCWWPIDFEPHWMRTIALALPTTWTMQAFNDLMIRRLPSSDVLGSVAATLGLGALSLIAGIWAISRQFR